VTPLAEHAPAALADAPLPSAAPLQLIDSDGHPGQNPGELTLPDPQILLELYRRMVIGRRFDRRPPR
jgi:pyruvate dehydrogenase E1 component alpha subunit